MKKYSLAMLVVLLAVMFVASTASALLLTVEPDDYADGTILNNVTPGITLSAVDGGSGATGNITALTSGFGASTGTKVFETPFSVQPGAFGDGSWDYMLIDLTALSVIDVYLDFVGTDSSDSNAVLAGYDIAGNLITSVTAVGPYGTGEFVTLSLNAPNMAYVAALGDPGPVNIGTLATLTAAEFGGGDSWGFDNLRVNVSVPEPATLLLLGFGLIGIGAARRRIR